MTHTTSSNDRDTQPWWRHGMVWLVLSGPLVVIVASFVTFGLIVAHPDPDVREGAAAASRAPAKATPSQLPALQARNHAATGGQ